MQPSTPTKPAVYADWASGVCVHPDQETITKHVAAMVEVSLTMFKASIPFGICYVYKCISIYV